MVARIFTYLLRYGMLHIKQKASFLFHQLR
ncbi:hypothetical protein E4N75_01915 [Treponema putidum]|nr:hypothetical protein E4N75_01915 [Treponema putidum]